jgi:hypothetical protein
VRAQSGLRGKRKWPLLTVLFSLSSFLFLLGSLLFSQKEAFLRKLFKTKVRKCTKLGHQKTVKTKCWKGYKVRQPGVVRGGGNFGFLRVQTREASPPLGVRQYNSSFSPSYLRGSTPNFIFVALFFYLQEYFCDSSLSKKYVLKSYFLICKILEYPQSDLIISYLKLTAVYDVIPIQTMGGLKICQ